MFEREKKKKKTKTALAHTLLSRENAFCTLGCE
jgi:hypothetical protein